MSVSSLQKSIEKLLDNVENNIDIVSMNSVIDYIDKINNMLETEKTQNMKVCNFTRNDIVELTKVLKNLDKTQQIEVFKVIQSQCKYSENSNGIFINMATLSNEILTKLRNLADYFINKNQKLDEETQVRNNIMETVNNDTHDEYNINIKKVVKKDSRFLDDIMNESNKYNTDITTDETKILQKEFDVYNELALSNKTTKTSAIGARIIKKCRELNKTLEE